LCNVKSDIVDILEFPVVLEFMLEVSS
jgi:hypothetical protein